MAKTISERIDESPLKGLDLEGWTEEEILEYLDKGTGPLAELVKSKTSPKESEAES